MNLATIHSEGSLISADLLSEIYTGETPGQQIKDFGIDPRHRLTDEIAASWSDARAYWESFKPITPNDTVYHKTNCVTFSTRRMFMVLIFPGKLFGC